jgi:hypothetical protein
MKTRLFGTFIKFFLIFMQDSGDIQPLSVQAVIWQGKKFDLNPIIIYATRQAACLSGRYEEWERALYAEKTASGIQSVSF